MRKIVFLLFSLTIFLKCDTANILGIFPFPGYSQFILGEKLMRELANRNHNVTVISAFKPKQSIKNYNTIHVEKLLDIAKVNRFKFENINVLSKVMRLPQTGLNISEIIFQNPDVQNLINPDLHFDAVLVETFFNEAQMNFAQHFKAPLISFSSIGSSEWNLHHTSGFMLPSITPMSFLEYHNHMNFLQRIRNTAACLFSEIYRKFVVLPKHQMLSDKYFGTHYDLNEIRNNVSLVLLNSHPVTSEAALLPPLAKEIGGFHIESQKLPQNIQDFLDNASEGAIYFSMGTNLKSKDLSKEKLQEILEVISKLQQRVLWKFEDDTLEKQPKNLLIQKWLPQSDILEHPNTVAFITHGGLISLTEALMFGVPVIGIPIFGDQKMNMARVCKNGFGILIPYPNFGKESLLKAVNEIVKNTTYRETARRLSNILRDEPIRPLDIAIHSIEQVIKNQGATHLRMAALDLKWFQIFGLDIVVFIFIIILAMIFIFKKSLKCLIAKKHDMKQVKKNKKNKKL